MFAYLRSLQAKQQAQQQALLTRLATTMRDSVRSQMHPLIQIDQHNNPEFAAPLAEIYMREFACTLQTLKQVNFIASKYHEHAFDNTDAYLEGQGGQRQLQTHEMTAEQRHAAQLLLGVGKSYSEINVALKMLDIITMRDVMVCDASAVNALARKFQNDPSVPEDAFDRLHHITKQVWSLVNMLAFSNLFRFADPAQPILIANPDDSIFIPHIPIVRQAEEVQVQQTCHVCAQSMNTPQKQPKHFNEIAEQLADEKITPEQACSLIEELRDVGIIADAMDAQNEQQKGFNEIAAGLADWKITTEEACGLFTEWISEHSK
jgi:hypothetical protein